MPGGRPRGRTDRQARGGAARPGLALASWLAPFLGLAFLPEAAAAWPLGDTLTVIMRPILGVPAIIARGETLSVEAVAPPETAGWSVVLAREPRAFPLEVAAATYDADRGSWTIRAPIGAGIPEALYDLALFGSGGVADTTARAVRVLERFEDEWYFAQVTDTHLPGHTFYPTPGWERDSTEEADFRAVIQDLNLIAPEFVLLTGDFINEGELEDHRGHRVYSRAQRMLLELEVPVFLVAGNHDIGGWSGTPPPDGTARRNWWRFFGWPRLSDAPDGVITQNYAFDYGPVRFVGLEAYINYDGWRWQSYGQTSFLPHQIDFLKDAIAARPAGGKTVVFCHMDFAEQIRYLELWPIDMLLYGHIHRDAGSITSARPALATEACADGNRTYRIVRVRGNRLGARETSSAGSRGDNLAIRFDRPNDGTARSNAATFSNEQPQPFEFAEAVFVMEKEGAPYGVLGGEIAWTFDADTALVVAARVPLEAGGTALVEILPSQEEPPPVPAPTALRLLGNAPNPFNGGTEIRLEIPEPGGLVEVDLFDSAGRYLFRIARGPFPGGSHAIPWDGRAPSGARLASGVYCYRVSCAGETAEDRLLYIR